MLQITHISILSFIGASLCMIGCDRHQHSSPPSAPSSPDTFANYAGSASCRDCHAATYQSWQQSHHGLAERPIDPDGLDAATFPPSPASPAFTDATGTTKLTVVGKDGVAAPHTVTRVIGHFPLRQYLTPTENGRLQAIDLAWDPQKHDWFSVFGDENRQPGEWGHWTGQGMNWNSMCAACHNTRLLKNYDPATDTYHTTMAEPSVSCEACHGPMKPHVDWQNKIPKGQKPTTPDPTIVRHSRDQMLATCAACHSRRAEITGDHIPGEPFDDHFSLTLTDLSDTYFPDGQVRDENYEYTSFISSRMHQAGVRCIDCHDPHSGKRIAPDNTLCMSCHIGTPKWPTAPAIDPVAHGHHADFSAGNLCTDCHMPTTTYMARHPRHDHSFSIPDPQLTLETGTPNACNRCHTDKDATWAAQYTTSWYGEKMNRPSRTRALAIARARKGDPTVLPNLIKLLAAETNPAWQATLSRCLAPWANSQEARNALLGHLTNPSPLVREASVETLAPFAQAGDPDIAKALTPLTADSSRAVRVAAAWALTPTLDPSTPAPTELAHMLEINSDQPLGLMRIAQHEFMRGDITTAITSIRKAITIDPFSPPFHRDLALLLDQTGKHTDAVAALKNAVKLDPQNPSYHYELALALHQTNDLPGTIRELEASVRLDPVNARAWYNLGLAYASQNNFPAAREALQKAQSLNPSDPDIQRAISSLPAR